MRTGGARLVALATALVVVSAAGAPALAQEEADTPARGQAVGAAGTALAMFRLLPGSIPPNSILPKLAAELPKSSAFEGAFGLAGAEVDSTAPRPYERSIATAAPFGGSLIGTTPVPGSLVQTSLPDNAKPLTGEFVPPRSPLDDLVRTRGMKGDVRARWSEPDGPCVGTISDAGAAAQSAELGTAVPTVPDLPITQLPLPVAKGFVPPGNLGTLGGLLSGPGSTGRARPLVGISEPVSARSAVTLVDLPGTEQARKSVRSTSTLAATTIDLFPGSPQGMTFKVVKRPTLQVTSTGSESTSRVAYSTPLLEVRRGKTLLFVLDAAHPTRDLPIGIPVRKFEAVPGANSVKALPFVGGIAESVKGTAKRLTGAQLKEVVDLFALRVSIAGLDQQGKDMEVPYPGHQLGASARLLEIQLLPTEALADALGERGFDLPSSLMQITLGEQVARAYAPEGGVRCGATPPAAAGPDGTPDRLLPVGTAYQARPMLWTAAVAVLVGVVLVSVYPRRRTPAVVPVRPSPRPRS